jgi:hypothetical protein
LACDGPVRRMQSVDFVHFPDRLAVWCSSPIGRAWRQDLSSRFVLGETAEL